MRRLMLLVVSAGLGAAVVASAAPVVASLSGLRDAPAMRVQPAWWRGGGVTPGGTAWHAGAAGGYRWGGAYHPDYAYHGYVGGWGAAPYATRYRAPVPVTPWYRPPPPPGAVAAGVVAGTIAGAAAAATVNHYAQPPTVVNNYYGQP